jgi:TonB family protein
MQAKGGCVASPFLYHHGDGGLSWMIVHGIFAIMMMIFFALALPVVQVPTLPPSPPIVTTVSHNEPTTRRQAFVVLRPESGQCSDGLLDISNVEVPMGGLIRSSSSSGDQPVNVRFRIDVNGRPLGIKSDSAAFGAAADLTPSLAASRFASGTPRDGCSIVYGPKRSSIADGDIHDLIGYSIFAQPRAPKEVFDRITPANSDCNTQRPAVLLRAFPDFEKIPATTGRSDWSMVQFDVDASGKPVSLKIFATTGNKALDKASADAVARSRFAKGEKKGCLYPYWRRGGTLAAPESKEIAAYRSEDSKCPQPMDWKYQPPLVYPENFRRRDIEGWAVIAFDLAPWGAVGNVKIVDAEPAAEFGEAARQIILSSTATPSNQGYSNCVARVRYAMGGQDRQTASNVD